MKRGALIVIDGIDGCGKSTQVRMLKKAFPKAVATHDPGGTPSGERIRDIVLGAKKLSPLTVFFLFLASRAALVEEVIAPALSSGRMVICDRFDSSTYAYQVHAGGHSEYGGLFRDFMNLILGKNTPCVYVILDGDPKKARERLFTSRAKDLNSYDKKPLSYHRTVREGYKRFKPRGAKVFFVDADRTPEEVHKDVLAIVKAAVR